MHTRGGTVSSPLPLLLLRQPALTAPRSYPGPDPQLADAVAVALPPPPSPASSSSMLMEETPPAAAAAQTLALAVAAAAACSVEDKDKATAKRARKRSRYLDDDYEIPTILNGLHADAALHDCIVTPPPPPAPRKGVAANEGPALLHRLNDANVAAPDLLAALHRRAASPYGHPPGPDGALLAFFALHRAASISVAKDATHCSGKDTAARPNPCRAMAVSNGSALVTTDQHRSNDAPRPNPCRAITVSNGSAGKEQQASAVAMAGHAAYAQAHHHIGVGVGVGPAAALGGAAGEAGPSKRRRKKKVALAPGAAGCSAQPPTHGAGAAPALDKANNKAVAFALGAPASAAGDGCSAQPPAAATHTGGGITGSTPKKAAKSKKAVNGQHFSKPVALILQFAPGTAADQLPSKEQLHTTLRGFGPLIEPSTEITRKQARVVFQSSAAAEAAYSCVHTLGTFAGARLQYLRPPPPPPKIPLTDVRKNLEKMIASLTGPSLLGKEESAWSLAGEMQHLLVKVDRALNAGAGPSTSVAAHHH